MAGARNYLSPPMTRKHPVGGGKSDGSSEPLLIGSMNLPNHKHAALAGLSLEVGQKYLLLLQRYVLPKPTPPFCDLKD